jgi:uncharacterized protein YqeY
MSDSVLKQAVSGFKIAGFSIKKGKDDEKLKLILEASVADLGAGEFDVGDVMNSLTNHISGDTDVGLSIFIQKKTV